MVMAFELSFKTVNENQHMDPPRKSRDTHYIEHKVFNDVTQS